MSETGETEQQEELLTYDQAVALLPDGGRVHTYVNPAGMLIGADWDRSDVLALLAQTSRREVAGPQASAMGHGLVAWRDRGPVFIETRRSADEAGEE